MHRLDALLHVSSFSAMQKQLAELGFQSVLETAVCCVPEVLIAILLFIELAVHSLAFWCALFPYMHHSQAHSHTPVPKARWALDSGVE
jgi:hypothetical protein